MSTQQDSRAQTEGVRYEVRGMLISAVFEHGTYESLAVMSDWAIETGGAELVRRANAYTEAVELLRRLLSTSPLMNHGAKMDAAAFLAKQPTEGGR